jgi:hypothetical protein
MAMLYGFQLLQRLALAVLPCGETVGMPAMHHSGSRAWARELNISREDKEVAFNRERTFCFKLMSHIHSPRILLS